jgi:cytochrome c biogenesis protein CcdA
MAFGAGLAGSIGPCAAPRYLAVAGLAGGADGIARARTLATFIAGVMTGSVAAVFSSGLLARALALESQLYLMLSVVFCGFGAWMLFVSEQHRCEKRHTAVTVTGGAFAAGAMCALVPSPCCTPVLLGLGALAASSLSWWSALLAVCFAAGHLLPLGVVALGAEPLARTLVSDSTRSAARYVGAGLALALGAFYGVLA